MPTIQDVLRTEINDYGPAGERLAEHARLLHGAILCVGESAELLDAVKKYCYYGKPLDAVNVKEEAADIVFGICVICDRMGWTIEELMQTVADKLQARYGDSFSEERATNRDLDAERKVLEGNQ